MPAAHTDDDVDFFSSAELTKDLSVLEHLKAHKTAFFDNLCAASLTQSEDVFPILRLESTYLLAEFFYLLRANGIETPEQLRSLAELHNNYVAELTKDLGRMARFGLTKEALLDAIFTGDMMPRLLKNWTDRKGAIDQSNLARFLVALMSPETCRKIVVACEAAGFLHRERTSGGAAIIISNGTIEQITAQYVRGVRTAIELSLATIDSAAEV